MVKVHSRSSSVRCYIYSSYQKMADPHGAKSGRARRWIVWGIGAAIGVIILASFMSRDDSVPVTSAKVTRSTIRSAVSTNGKVEPVQNFEAHAWRKRSTDDVAREMAKAKEYWPYVKEFFFDDDTFNIQKARTIELCEKLKPLKLTWSCTSRVTTDYETLKAMKEAGCRLMIVGFESGDQQILKNIKKGATLERARQFTKDAHKLGLVIHGDFILGLPGETRETIKNTISFAKELDVETIQVSVAHAYPGTELYEFAIKNNFLVKGSMVDEGGHQLAHIEYPGLPADEVLQSVHRFYDEYYFRPKAVVRILKKAVFDSAERKRLYKDAKTFLKLRSQRNKLVRDKAKNAAKGAANGNGNGHLPPSQDSTPAPQETVQV